MKFYNIILFASLILFIYTEDTQKSECDSKTSAEKAKDCKDLKTYNSDQHCCYAKGKDKSGNTMSACVIVDKDNYDNIKDFIEKLEDQGYEVKKLDCKSNYLELSILIFILLLL